MACYHPLKAWPIGVTDNGKIKYKVTEYAADHVEILGNGSVVVSAFPGRSQLADRVITDYVEIPCGKCIGCRLDYSRQWADRCMLELQSHDEAWFLTLTYKDEFLPQSYYADPLTGEAYPSYTLDKRDFQLFLKRLRFACPDDNIRYFACGEYGGQTFRPHYHAILFGLHLHDLKPLKQNFQGQMTFESETIKRAWSVGSGNGKDNKSIGFHMLGTVTWESCAYVARYIMKKQTGPEAEFYTNFGLQSEFTLMSRRPGIAREYYDTHPDIYEKQHIMLSTETGGRQIRPPKYYDKLYDIDHPEEMAEIKAARQRMAKAANELKLQRTTLNYMELLEVAERRHLDGAKKLIRSYENAQKANT